MEQQEDRTLRIFGRCEAANGGDVRRWAVKFPAGLLDTLRGGMLVTVQVVKARHTNTIIVPRTALIEGERGASVFTLVDPPGPAPAAGPAGGAQQPVIKQAKAVPVEVGLETDTLVEIRSPDVPAGTAVITTRPDALQDKSIVAMSASSAPGAGQTAK